MFSFFSTAIYLAVVVVAHSSENEDIDDDRTWINTEETLREHYLPFYVQVGVLGVLFTMSALFSGLNLGLMTLSVQELNLVIKSGSKEDARNAKAILPIRMKGNYLLCTILIVNVVVNAAISILFEDLTSGTIAFVAASFGILLFGEITPQSVCVKHGLEVGARTILITKFFMFITAPISYPISKVLDYLIGNEVGQFDRGRLIELLKMSAEAGQNKDMAQEVKIAVGAMEFASKVAKDVMTRIDDVFMLSENDILDAATLTEIIHKGYTRIPAVAEFNERQLRIVDEDMPLPQLLDEFKEGNYHLAMVRQIKPTSILARDDTSIDQFEELRVTLEDLLEEILQSEIIDESDSVMDNVNRLRRHAHQVRGPLNFFYDRYMEERAREKMIQKNIRHVILVSGKQDKRVLLYEAGVPSKRFILILEGTAVVSFSKVRLSLYICPFSSVYLFEFQTNMTFEVGPWTCFGEILFQKISASIRSRQDTQLNMNFTPDFDLLVPQTCRFLQLPIFSVVRALRISRFVKQLRTPKVSTSDEDDPVPLFLGGRRRGRDVSNKS
ncbi:unnamed protein product [Strongylus vulgaris]|uniref:CNNM transmembrane domain-containing protein n=1 Tax=Strongylus vulgaris TaxID=40348 RepID=A0A3P7KWM4_STRVU|nr:unnamed protein product [Strongylus vulgaris]